MKLNKAKLLMYFFWDGFYDIWLKMVLEHFKNLISRIFDIHSILSWSEKLIIIIL